MSSWTQDIPVKHLASILFYVVCFNKRKAQVTWTLNDITNVFSTITEYTHILYPSPLQLTQLKNIFPVKCN